MLLREFAVDNHIISLIEDEQYYIAQVAKDNGEKIFCHEYKDYDKVKACFDEIVEYLEREEPKIEYIIEVLQKSTL